MTADELNKIVQSLNTKQQIDIFEDSSAEMIYEDGLLKTINIFKYVSSYRSYIK